MAAASIDVLKVWALELDKAASSLAARYQLQTLQSSFLVRLVQAELSSDELIRLSADQHTQYGRITNSTRRKEWSESRRCCWTLERFNYRSLSHSNTGGQSEPNHVVMAWGLLDSSSVVQGIGIDVEVRSRLISDSLVERFTRSAERKLGISGLALWTIKEALFKANRANQGTVVTDYEILNRDPDGMGQGRGPQSETYLFHSFELGPWQITLALQATPNQSRIF